MSRRVSIGASGSSPFRVAISGVDASTAGVDKVLFDANQAALRLRDVGWIEMLGSTPGAFYSEAGPSFASTPIGQYRKFSLMARLYTDSPARNHYHYGPGYFNMTSPNCVGFGAVMNESKLYPINFTRTTTPSNSHTYINYAVYDNYL